MLTYFIRYDNAAAKNLAKLLMLSPKEKMWRGGTSQTVH